MRALFIMPLLAVSTVSFAQPATPPVATAAANAAPDQAKLAIGRKVAARLVPDGSFMKVMSGTLDTMTSGMMDQMMDIPVKDLAGLVGISEEAVQNLGPGTLREIMTILDPAFKERTEIGMKAMFSGMGGIMSAMEPEMREGMAIAYANRFSVAELTDLDTFFASPSGQRFAAENMTIMTDPALVSRMQGLMPKIIEAVPAIAKKAEEATASLPKPKRVSDLDQADKSRLEALLGAAKTP
jgi:hypothetical protein